jgi:hypothetical protein
VSQRFSLVRSAFAWLPRVLVALLVSPFTAGAAPALDEVEVTSVRFTNVRVPANLGSGGGASGNWLEADVALTVRPPANSRGQMISRVRVSLLVGFELPGSAGGERRIEHYRAEAECVALEAGRADVRFYLPPEVVKRDRVHGDPEYWGVEISVGGKAVTAGRAAYATTLASAEQRKNFQTRGGQLAAANDGILLPQYLTPFAHEYARATPSFVRRDGR